MSGDRIAALDAWVVRFLLDRPIHLGRWTIPHREYAVLELHDEGGRSAAAYALTRDADVAPALAALAARALDREPAALLPAAAPQVGTTSWDGPIHPGVRAAALLDACAWDLAAQARGVPLWALLAGDGPPADPPAATGVAVCGYPVGGAIDTVAVVAEVESALADGYREVKLPALGTPEQVDERLAAVSALDDRLSVILDLEGAHTEVGAVLERARLWQRHPLRWLEDPFSPSNAELVPALVEASPTTVAIGDEWPEPAIRSLLADARSRPLLRLDFAALGGLSASRAIALEAGAPVAQHIYPELQRHLVHAGLAVPQLDVYREQPAIDFADRMLGPTAAAGGHLEAPRGPGPCMELDHELVAAHATWHVRREHGGIAPHPETIDNPTNHGP